MTADAEVPRPRVYVIVGARVRDWAGWPKIRYALKARTKGAKLAVYDDVFTGREDYEASWQAKLAGFQGGVVVPYRRAGDAQWVGNAAEREANFMTGISLPVFLNAPEGLIPWTSVKLQRQEVHPAALPLMVISDEFRSTP